MQNRLYTAVGTPWVRTMIVLWIAQVISEMAFSFALPFIPLYIQELGVSDVTQAGLWAGIMSGGFALMMGIMGPIWGMIADRFGRRLMIQRALFGACLVISAMSLVQGPEQLLVLRIIQGALTGVVAATTTVVSLTVPRSYLGTALGFMHAALFVGTAIGPVLGGLVADSFGFRAAFGVTGLLFLVAGSLVTLFVSEPPRTAAETSPARPSLRSDVRQLLRRRELVVVLAIMALIRFANMAPSPILPLYIQQLVGGEAPVATLAGLVVAATGVASTVSALAVGYIADRFGRRRTLAVCLLAASVLSVPHAFATTVWQLLALRTAVGLALGGMSPAAQSLFTDHTPPDRRGTGFGLLATAGAVGNGGGPVFGSALAAAFSVPAVFLGMAPVFLAGAWLLTYLSPARSKPPAA